MGLQSEWLKARRDFLADIKRQVKNRLGPSPKAIERYVRDYDAEFSRVWRADSMDHLISRIGDSKIVLGADFHAFSESQRIHLRILRLLPKTQKVLLVFEALQKSDHRALSLLASGKLSRAQFLKRVQWQKRWGFPFENYQPLFDLAFEREFSLRGLSGPKSGQLTLTKRDQNDATTLAHLRKEFPDHLIYVVIGDLHLADRHLPRALVRAGAVKSLSDVTRILQNSEHLYFRLAQKGREHNVEVMSAPENRFCILSSPPWVKWQSYLMYLERAYDEELYDRTADFTECVKSHLKILLNDFKADVNLNRIDVMATESSLNLEPLSRGLSKSLKQLIRHSVATERSFYLPEKKILWLARASLNHAATLAGLYLQAEWSRLRQSPSDFPKHFEALIWMEAIGYFSSKLINHKRKTEALEDIKRRLRIVRPEEGGREVLRLALSQRLKELDRRFPPLQFRAKNANSYIDAGRIVGQMHGEKMYSLFKSGSLSRNTAKTWISADPMGEDFLLFYRRVLKKLNPQKRSG